MQQANPVVKELVLDLVLENRVIIVPTAHQVNPVVIQL